MSPWDLLPVTAALGWSTLIANLVVLPFYNVREKWHKDYVDSGAIAQAGARIDSKKLLPSLAEIVDLAIAERGRAKSKVDTATLLETIDFLPSLEKVEAATREKGQLDQNLDALHMTAKRLWRCGLAHIGSTIAVWVAFAVAGAEKSATNGSPIAGTPHSGPFWVLTAAVGAAWIVSLLLACRHFFKYDQRRDAFLTALKTNR